MKETNLSAVPRISERSWKNWFADVWRAMQGNSFVAMRVTVFPQSEIREVYIECHQDLNWPLVTDRNVVCGDLMQFNRSSYYPLVRQKKSLEDLN